MDLNLTHKKAVVCAASKGLGKAIAAALLKEGVELLMCARDSTVLNSVANEFSNQYQTPVHRLACDLSLPKDRQAFIDYTHQTLGHPDILIHNVGGPPPKSTEESSLADWEASFQQLFLSIIELNQAFLPPMKAQNWGRIIIITSLSAFQPIPNLALSNGIRGAITQMAKSLADEVAAHQVTVNCVAPGIIHTDRTEERIKDHLSRYGGSRESVLEQYANDIPLKRLGRPEELADTVVFLTSDKASYITGSTICVDGGKRRSYH